MTEHIHEWLGAYHDGELNGARLRLVEAHLAACSLCRAELGEIRSLSVLLRQPLPETLSTQRFAADLALRLPRRQSPARPPAWKQAGWWLVPVGLLLALAFIEITYALSAIAVLAANAGLLGESTVWTQAASLQMSWFAAVLDLFGGPLGAAGQSALGLVNEVHLTVARWTARMLPQLVLSAAYLGWLMAWWLRRSQPGPAPSTPQKLP